MSEHVAAMIAECEQHIAMLTDLTEKLRWFQREFPHTSAAMVPIQAKRRGPKPGPKPGRVAKPTNGTASPALAVRPSAPAAAVQKRTGSMGASRTGMASPASSDIVQARDAAIIGRLKKGPAGSAVLTDAMPNEPGLSDEQKAHACRNALTRLRVKKIVKQDAGGNWIIA